MLVSMLHAMVPIFSGLEVVRLDEICLCEDLLVSYSFSVLNLTKVFLYCTSLSILERSKVLITWMRNSCPMYYFWTD